MTARRFGVVSLLLAALAGPVAAEDLFFESAGVKLHYTVEGQGEPVVLIHGFGANIDVNWGKPGIIQALAERYRVVALDHRGHGKSDKPHEAEAYRGQLAGDVVRLLDHLKIKQAHVVGYSLGGFVTLRLMAAHPERLRSAVIGGAGWNPTAVTALQPMIDRLAESLEQGKGLGPLVTMLAPSGDAAGGADAIEAANRRLLARNDPLALAAVIRTMFVDQPAEAKLRDNTVPALALVGEQDLLRAWAEALGRTAPNVEVSVIAGANHLSAVTSPEFLARVKKFLSEHSPK
jgi:pimeloyl-ACP methyl ester carboxylesterase